MRSPPLNNWKLTATMVLGPCFVKWMQLLSHNQIMWFGHPFRSDATNGDRHQADAVDGPEAQREAPLGVAKNVQVVPLNEFVKAGKLYIKIYI